MPICTNCERHLTPDFVRVFGRDGEVRGCIHCTDARGDPKNYING